MKQPTALAHVLSVAVFAVVTAAGCNALLGNDEGTPRVAIDGSVPAPEAGPRPVDAGGQPTCDTTQGNKVCFGLCVKIDQPNTGCGGSSCAACDPKNVVKTACKGGASTLACGYDGCLTGFDNCDGQAANGCETSLGLKSSCGSCATSCQVPTPLCAVTAGVAACVAACPVDTKECSGACVDTRESLDNCGDCGIKCQRQAAIATCQAGACKYVCQPGTHACGNVCASDIDPKTCGPSCTDCPATKPNTTPTCISGSCGITCMKGFLDCDGDPSNGCEVSGVACPPPTGNCGGMTCGPKLQCCNNACISTLILCNVILPPVQ